MNGTITGIIGDDMLESCDEAAAELALGFDALDASVMIIDEFAELQDDIAETDHDMMFDTGYGAMRLQDIQLDTLSVDELEH